MTIRVLILEQDILFREQLGNVLIEAGNYTVDVTDCWQSACLFLANDRYNLALVGVSWAEEGLLPAFRKIQFDLRVALLTENIKFSELDPDKGSFQGILLHKLQTSDLVKVIASILSFPVAEADVAASRRGDRDRSEEFERLQLQFNDFQVPDQIKGLILSHSSGVLKHYGQLTPSLAAACDVIIRHQWSVAHFPQQLLFLDVFNNGQKVFLYAESLSGSYILISLADSDKPLENSRAGILDLAAGLKKSLRTKTQPQHPVSRQTTFVVVWQAIAQLPPTIKQLLRKTLVTIATEKNCNLQQIEISEDVVQVIIACPKTISAYDVAHTLKYESQTTIQREYEVPALLWKKGYFAKETDNFLTESELNLFLDH